MVPLWESLSVTSSKSIVSCDGLRSIERTIDVTRSTKVPSCSCRGDTLTCTLNVRSTSPAANHARASWQAWLITQSPMGTIAPDSFARCRNWAGNSRPRAGWSHRSSASAPTTRPLWVEMIGWYARRSSSLASARSSSAASSFCSTLAARIASVYISTRERPRRLAVYIAASA